MLTDLLITDEREANAIAASTYPLGQWQGIDVKNQSPVTLAVLLCLLAQEPYRDEVVDEFTSLTDDSPDGPWVCKIPDRFVLALSRLRTEDLPSIAKQWSQTDEIRAAGIDTAKDLLENLTRISTEALRQRKSLLLWMSL